MRRAGLIVLAALLWPAAAARADDVTFSEPLGTTGSKLHAPAETAQFPLAPHGYVEEERLVSGTATAPGGDPLPFTTRVVVRRPADAQRANGTVVLEWMNVSLQQDTDVDWLEGYREILHDGFTYVAVSVQPTGVPLPAQDPVRYGQIRIPPYAPNADTGGPRYGESLFAQIAHALKAPAGAPVLGGAPARRIIAAGESQSAQRLSCYLLEAKAVDPVFDGFLIDHGECAGPTVGANDPFAYAPPVPTMMLMGMAESRPAMRDREHLRVWQIAGASHVDAWIGAYGKAEHNWDDTGQPQDYDERTAGAWGLEGGQGGTCSLFSAADPVRADELPQQYTHDTAIAALHTWITTGRAPVATAPLKFDPQGAAARDGSGGGVAADRLGNPLGGLRLPQIDVPVAQYQGTCPEQGQALIGTTRPFTDARLRELYPTFAAYRTKMCAASAAAVDEGTLLAFDAQDIDRRVLLARTRWPRDAQGEGECPARVAAGRRAPACRSRRTVVVHARVPRHARKVFVGGRRVAARRVGRTGLRISLRGRGAGTVRIVVRSGHSADRRTYHLCRPRLPRG
jgi:hypothetical protein